MKSRRPVVYPGGVTRDGGILERERQIEKWDRVATENTAVAARTIWSVVEVGKQALRPSDSCLRKPPSCKVSEVKPARTPSLRLRLHVHLE